MSDMPVQVVIAAFADEHGAESALQELQQREYDGLIAIRDAAVIHRDEQGKVCVDDKKHHHGIGRGVVIGGVAGAIVGLLTGPVGWATGGGAVVGALASKLRSSGFHDERLQQVADAVRPGTSALVAVVDHVWLKEVADLVAGRTRDIVTAAIQADIASQLEAGRDVAYTALDIAENKAVARVGD